MLVVAARRLWGALVCLRRAWRADHAVLFQVPLRVALSPRSPRALTPPRLHVSVSTRPHSLFLTPPHAAHAHRCTTAASCSSSPPSPAGVSDQRDGPEVLVIPGGLASATPILAAACPEVAYWQGRRRRPVLCARLGEVRATCGLQEASRVGVRERSKCAAPRPARGSVRGRG